MMKHVQRQSALRKNPSQFLRGVWLRTRFICAVLGVSCLTNLVSELHGTEVHRHEVVIYGGTSAAVMAAVQTRKMGKTVVIVSPDKRLGGLSSGGLGWTDTGDKSVIGGLARDFYHRIWQEYQKPETWTWQNPSEYGNRGQGNPAMDGVERTMWIFEPKVALKVFEDYIKEYEIPVYRDEWLDRETGVKLSGGSIRSIRTLSGKTFEGSIFVDATYEGDLMAAAKVDYHVGREANAVYGETWNGNQVGVLHHRHHFGVLKKRISPYWIPGDPASGVLPRISTEAPGRLGEGDRRVQAYCFRMCLTNHPENRIPFEKPEGYDPKQYELLARIYEAGWDETFDKFDPLPNQKTDTNNHGPFSTDNIGMSDEYPEASYERRHEIIREHELYQKGWLYFICSDPRVPKSVREEMRSWGLPKDEYVENGHWSPQLYIREARRMMGKFVMTEKELLKEKPTPESVGMGSYTIDSHNVRRYITEEGYVQNEGDIGVSSKGPYEIAYGALVPKKDQVKNLLVPVCVSSSHIAFGSIRMEPVFMILAQSAATAGVMALDAGIAVQDVPYDALKKRLLQDAQILSYSDRLKQVTGVDPKGLPGIVVDDSEAVLKGVWLESSSSDHFLKFSYRHDGNDSKEEKSASFRAELPKAGTYEVRLAVVPHANRARKVPIQIRHAKGTEMVEVDQTQKPSIQSLWVSLGRYEYREDQEAEVIIQNKGTEGFVVIDGVQWLPVEEVKKDQVN